MSERDDMAPDERGAWSEFWAQNAGPTAGGCLPERWAAIEDAQRTIWRDFIKDLPSDAALLDLATGDGRVLGWMREIREDLALTGIDLAPQLPEPPDGTSTQGGVAMEQLPFEDDSFAAVVSQFGLEYGDVSKVAAEIARVLMPGGRVGLMVHRGDGPILEHNAARRAAIEWVIGEQSLGSVMRNALTAPDGGLDAAVQVAAALAMLGAHKFGQQTPAWEIPEAMRQAVLLGQREGNESIIASFEAIEGQANNELGRIASLERACSTADDRDAIEEAFSAHGLTLQSTSSVDEPSSRALADFLTFK